MRDRSKRIYRLLNDLESRTSYIKAKLTVLVPAQIRALRLKSKNPPMPKQSDLAYETALHQSRISMFETPGMSNMTLETLARVAAGLKVGVIIKFVPFHEMLRWENEFHPSTFDVLRLEDDSRFLDPDTQNEIALASTPVSQNELGGGRKPPSPTSPPNNLIHFDQSFGRA